MSPGSLDSYRRKRDFARTREPRPRRGARGGWRFVVQQHAARSVHFDFRLEVDGVLVSWAVPKGPSLNPRHKRLAIRTEDHPVAYASFEGVIPKGQYGAGRVIVWDRGTYRNLLADKPRPATMRTALRRGLLEIALSGRKLRGGFALTRIRGAGQGSQWLLVKRNDARAERRRNPVTSDPRSVRSGRTVRELPKP